jgi:protein-S-isoprenylcysteine O-methyltransferase Ste14
MSTTEKTGPEPPKRSSIPLWVGFVGATLVWEVVPWVISLLTPYYGWVAGRPGPWNLLGLILVILGTIGLFRGLLRHSAETPGRVDMEPAKTYLLKDGLYRYSRNPMYLFELILLFGWVIFYGSFALLVACVVWWAFFNFYQIPQEERILEASFDESYREYARHVPRWLGRPRA